MEENERTDEYKVGEDKRVIELPDSPPPAMRKPPEKVDDLKLDPPSRDTVYQKGRKKKA